MKNIYHLVFLLLVCTQLSVCQSFIRNPTLLNNKYWSYSSNFYMQKLNGQNYLTNKNHMFNMILDGNTQQYTKYEGFTPNFGDDISAAVMFTGCKEENKCIINKTEEPISVKIQKNTFKADKAVTRFQWSGIQDSQVSRDFEFFMLRDVDDQLKNYQYNGFSIGFKPTAPIFDYLLSYVNTKTKEDAIYFGYSYNSLWASNTFDAFNQKIGTLYNKNLFALANFPNIMKENDEFKTPFTKTGRFRPISSKTHWTMDKVSIKVMGEGYPSITNVEACISDTNTQFADFNFNHDDFLKKIFKDACNGETIESCQTSFDSTKLPDIEFTIDGVTKVVKSEDYFAWVWKDEKKQNISQLYWGLMGTTEKPYECPPSSKIILGRLYLRRFKTTMRAARNGEREIAVQGFGKVQYQDPPRFETSGSWFGLIAFVLVIGAIIGGVWFYLKNRKQNSNENNNDPSFTAGNFDKNQNLNQPLVNQ